MLISEDGTKNLMGKSQALEMAESQGVDLVQVGTSDGNAVCKLMDYKKFMYNQKKNERKNNKPKQELKEIRFNEGIADNDIKIKAKAVSRILKENDKVKVSITYKGRMIKFVSNGLKKLEEFKAYVEGDYNVDTQPRVEGNRVYMILSPKSSNNHN